MRSSRCRAPRARVEPLRHTLAVLSLMIVASCTPHDGTSAAPEPGERTATSAAKSANMDDPFAMTAMSEMKTLKSLTLWRVGVHAEGPGREPEEPIAASALANDASWAYSVDGDSRTDSTRLRVPPDAPAREAQTVLVGLVETATGRKVHAVWSAVDADTWTASASFVE